MFEPSAERRLIKNWNGIQDVVNTGMLVQLKREGQASIQYAGDHAQFRINPDPASSEYVASRISDINTRVGVNQRVKPWQPYDGRAVTSRFEVRYLHEQTTLTYNLMMWNAPFAKGEIIPATSIGVTRSVVSDFEYAMLITQNVVIQPHSGNLTGDVLRVVKLKEAADWLDMTRWHWVNMMFTENQAQIEVKQGARNVVIEEKLAEPVEALGFVFSVDNEIFPSRYIPVSTQEDREGFDMAFFEAGYSK